MNPQPPDLESGALPLELLAFSGFHVPCSRFQATVLSVINQELRTWHLEPSYFASLWGVCLRHQRQYFLTSTLSGVFCLFLVVE